MNLYVVRHGKTQQNIDGIVIGRIDVPICEEGRKGIYELRNRLKEVNFEKAFSSPLIRTVETSNILLENRDCSIEYDERLIERNFGRFEGHPSLKDGEKIYWDRKYMENGLESFDEIISRVNSFINQLKENYKEKDINILIVTHACVTIAFENIMKTETIDKDVYELMLKNGDYRIYKI